MTSTLTSDPRWRRFVGTPVSRHPGVVDFDELLAFDTPRLKSVPQQP
ncbi:hypothetical protein [Nocardia abscessus]|nr:hypothetical protein [Nocardia abscessus]